MTPEINVLNEILKIGGGISGGSLITAIFVVKYLTGQNKIGSKGANGKCHYEPTKCNFDKSELLALHKTADASLEQVSVLKEQSHTLNEILIELKRQNGRATP